MGVKITKASNGYQVDWWTPSESGLCVFKSLAEVKAFSDGFFNIVR